MVVLNLAVLLAKKKWSVADLYRETGIRYNTLNDYYHEMAISIKFEHIDKICAALGCTVGELIEYTPVRKRGRPKKIDH